MRKSAGCAIFKVTTRRDRAVICKEKRLWQNMSWFTRSRTFAATEKGAGGSVTIHAVVDGLIQKYVFTPV